MLKKILIATRFGNLLIMSLGLFLAYLRFSPVHHWLDFVLALLSLNLIAIGGYVENDFRDKELDEVNKPGRNVFNFELFKRFHLQFRFLFPLVAIAIGVYLDWSIGLLNAICFGLLYVYAHKLKGIALVGNVLIAFLQSAVFLMSYLLAMTHLEEEATSGANLAETFTTVLGHVIYGGFAFTSGWIREMIKDLEDKKGDEAFGLKTFAVSFSEKSNKRILYVLESCLIIGIAILTASFVKKGFDDPKNVIAYFFGFLVLPMSVRLFLLTRKAAETKDWRFLSQWMKIIMLAGIVSIAFL